jgi:hypothetical protein
MVVNDKEAERGLWEPGGTRTRRIRSSIERAASRIRPWTVAEPLATLSDFASLLGEGRTSSSVIEVMSANMVTLWNGRAAGRGVIPTREGLLVPANQELVSDDDYIAADAPTPLQPVENHLNSFVVVHQNHTKLGILLRVPPRSQVLASAELERPLGECLPFLGRPG